MKKNFGRKLRLNKETIADLEQRKVRGGWSPTRTCTDTDDCTEAITCQTYCKIPCPCEYPITATEVGCHETMLCETMPC
jgi:hypothetical protein